MSWDQRYVDDEGRLWAIVKHGPCAYCIRTDEHRHLIDVHSAPSTRRPDIWVVLTPNEAAWLARHVGASLTVMSKDDETVRISNIQPERADQPSLLTEDQR